MIRSHYQCNEVIYHWVYKHEMDILCTCIVAINYNCHFDSRSCRVKLGGLVIPGTSECTHSLGDQHINSHSSYIATFAHPLTEVAIAACIHGEVYRLLTWAIQCITDVYVRLVHSENQPSLEV